MGKYLDNLNAEFAEITERLTTVVERAADEKRDVTDDEQAQVDRDKARLAVLEPAIKDYTEQEEQRTRVALLRSRVAPAPAGDGRQLNAAPVVQVTEPAYDIKREFPSAGHYAVTLHRAQVEKDKDAIEKIDRMVKALERATEHQTTADNPGLLPRPILGPVISILDNSRPSISSFTTAPLPAGSFDRPHITRHVAVGVQAQEKTQTESRRMHIGKLPVEAATFAGHLNISRQDIKWSNPGILQIVFTDFADVYAIETNEYAAQEFSASVTREIAVPAFDAQAIYSAIFAAAVAGMNTNIDGRKAGANGMPTHLWVSPDVWGALGSLLTPMGVPLFPSMEPGSTTGNPLGLSFTVDASYDPGTAILGPGRRVEWYEDVDGLMQVGEPDVLGQLVGYAGYGALLNTTPSVFTRLDLTAAPDAATPEAVAAASRRTKATSTAKG